MGNSKLGPHIHSWSIPAISTCPGRSALCEQLCYAAHGHYNWPSTIKLHRQNLAVTRTTRFVPWFIAECRQRAVRVMRVHTSGDFYDADYTRKWLRIARATPRVQFFAYTRSWRIWEIYPILLELGKLENFSLWWSVDRETGAAPITTHIRSAYLARDDADAEQAPPECDLVFRDKYKTSLKHTNGVLVCPAENGIVGALRHTCTTCGVCYRKQPSLASAVFKRAATEIHALPTTGASRVSIKPKTKRKHRHRI